MDRTAKLRLLRSRHAQAVAAVKQSGSQANQAALEDAEAELANAQSDATDDERLDAVASGLRPLVEQLSANAVEPMRSWIACVRVAVAQLEDAQRAKKDGSRLDPERLAGQAEDLIEAVTRLRPT